MSIQLPEKFVKRVTEDEFLGSELLSALENESPTAIRLNPWKTKPELSVASAIPWSENGFFLTERPKFTLDPLFHAGAYYPQEAGSQLLESVLKNIDLPENPVILDLCAAPGGKSTLISSFLNNTGLLVSNEVISARSRVLKENSIKLGNTNSIVTNNDPADFERVPGTFDCVVVDAPCSGEGMFRKDHDARNEWSEANVELCSARQKRIVMDIWPSVKAGGFLIYSTCTFNSAENEENVKWFAQENDAEIVHFELEYAKAGRENIGFYALPSELDTEGFYIAVIRKKEGREVKPKYTKNTQLYFVKGDSLPTDLFRKDDLRFIQWSDFVFALPEKFTEAAITIHHHLRVIKLGTELGQPTRKEFIPNEALALSPFLLTENVQKSEVSLQEALLYLKGDTFPLNSERGFQLITYKNEPLGWIKHLGNRFNNLYPKDWRIRMRID